MHVEMRVFRIVFPVFHGPEREFVKLFIIFLEGKMRSYLSRTTRALIIA